MVRRGGSCNRAGLMPVRCVIVDDNASFREEMRGLLAEQGLDVVGGAGSSAEAFRQIAQLRPDVALIDIDLGGESGLELARQLRETPGPNAVPYLILISTHDEAEYADLIEASSAIGFLAKIDLSAAAIRRMLAAVNGDRADEV
jgi:DNA-binding NarL/FixJ family response regulator